MALTLFKRNSLVLAYLALYLLALVLVMLEIDKQYYQQEKREIIRENIETYFREKIGDQRRDMLVRLSLSNLNTSSETSREELDLLANAILDEDNNIFRIAIRPSAEPGEEGLGERPYKHVWERNKFQEYNTLANSLFLRNFEGVAALPLADPANNNRLAGRLFVHYTTPLGNDRIRELTVRYRWYCGFIALVLTLLAGGVARKLLFPLREVMIALESSTPRRTAFIRRPRARLEQLYNRMATDTVIVRLQNQLRGEVAQRPQMTGWEVVELVCRAFAEQISPGLVACLELVGEGPGRLRPTGQRVVEGALAKKAGEAQLAQWLEEAMPADGRGPGEFSLSDGPRFLRGAMRLLEDPERSGIRYLLAIVPREPGDEGQIDSVERSLERLMELIHAGLQMLSTRNRLLVQERGRANISLSRNLGHDLTNIIATSKLELMALERVLKDGAVPDDERRRALIVDGLQGLLRSVRFMQSTVDLYRAYAFLQHPVLETHDGNKLVEETLELFALSTSARIRTETDLKPDVPRCVVDPRLIKLAVFNLFNNALEAIRKNEGEADEAEGWIRVETAASDEGGLIIRVTDSGTGILNKDGERARAHEIEQIFELGYTSRKSSGQSGEGLGLNWVRTIVEDLHGGTLRAENANDAGACFIMELPPLDREPRSADERDVAG